MITKLKLTNFKNFKEAQINFGPVSILVGTNATGKSNVRDAFRFLHGIARGYTLAEIIGEKYGEGGQLQWSGIRGGTRETCFSGEGAFSVGVEIEHKEGTSSNPAKYSYEITVQCGVNGSAPRVVKESLYRQGSMLFDSHPSSFPPDQVDRQHLAVRLRKTASQLKMGAKFLAIAAQPVLSQAGELAKGQQAVGKFKEHLEATLQELESIRFIDFSPELMRKPSIPGQLILSDRGDNLSSVLQAICEIDNGIHPARLALLMDLLDNQSKGKGIQIVATTHSPQVLRLIKEENLKYVTLAYRLKGNTEGRLKPLTEIPHLLDVIKRKDIARLHESSWMENTMEFSEGTPKPFPLEGEEGAQ